MADAILLGMALVAILCVFLLVLRAADWGVSQYLKPPEG